MADLFTLTGTFAAYPASGSPSADPIITAPIDERQMLGLELQSQLVLSADPAVALPFGGLTGAHVVIIKSVGGPVTVRLTTADESAQIVTVDSFAVLMSASKPYTAITVQRAPAVATTIKFFLGQKAN